MTAKPELTSQLRAQVLTLENDLRTRLELLPEIKQQWRDEYDAAISRNRTAAAWETWRDEQITQVAVAWVLTTVFIRFCEDNRLVSTLWFTAPDSRREQALDAQQEFLRAKASQGLDVTDRDWILDAIEHLKGLRATANLVDANSPLWLLSPSGDAATAVIDFWRARDDGGELLRDLTDPEWETRFLGDLYQDMSEAAKKKFALLQTPVFIEEFILDRTFEPAVAERPLDGFKAIDPTCGSGHFLLGLFARLLDRWHAAAPGMDERTRVQKALDSVYGVDLNPFAVAIARFRLTLAALKASGGMSLEDAPSFNYHLAVGDSLLFGNVQTLFGDADVHDFAYTTEERHVLEQILADNQYDVVVGNPPYITVSDRAVGKTYRDRYDSCSGKYALTVPFMERFFGLAKSGESPGWIGQITSNSFMKREFGTKLIEDFLPQKDLRLVADTSGAYIPGHGTPTVILVGCNNRPATPTVRAVLGVQGEPGRPNDPARGLVWSSISSHVNEPGWSDDWITVADLNRSLLRTHPWSLRGGSAIELQQAVEAASPSTLINHVEHIGVFGMTNADDVMIIDRATVTRRALEQCLPLTLGDGIRDWHLQVTDHVFYPYDESGQGPAQPHQSELRLLWPTRTVLWSRAVFGGGTYQNAGRPWFEWHQLVARQQPLGPRIAFAEVATHNHFVLDRGGKVFKQTAPVIKLRVGATEEDHLKLLGVLNSSVACFWLKQNSYSKGNGGIGGGIGDEAWEPRYAFNASTVQDFPLPARLDPSWGSRMQALIERANFSAPEQVVADGRPSRGELHSAQEVYESRRRIAIAFQEDIDWAMYREYGLIDEDLTGAQGREVALGQRAFEIVLARKAAAGEVYTAWFARHGSAPITEVPAEWSGEYGRLIERRIEVIESNPFIGLLERPEYKRRWASESWEVREKRVLAGLLLDRLEDRKYWFDNVGRPVTKSVQLISDEVSRDDELMSVLRLWDGRQDIPVATMLATLLDDQAVPFLAAYRYKDSGLRKRAVWENTWSLQRREDAGETLASSIPVPPKYATADFVKQSYWSHRGKLDVPKERFIVYPNAGRDTDPTAVLGWAGWDHAQQSLALAALIGQRSADGWDDERLVPLVAGLVELLPWVRQWHGEFDAFYSSSPAQFFTEQLSQWTGKIRKTVDELTAWRLAPATRGRRASTT